MKMLIGKTVLVLSAAAVLGVVVYHRLGTRREAPAPVPTPNDWYATSENRAILTRTEAKRQVACELIAGRLSLLQAASTFRDLDARGPCSNCTRLAFPVASSEDEAYCLSVIGYVSAQPPRDRSEELSRRLSDELDAHRRDGTLHLSDP